MTHIQLFNKRTKKYIKIKLKKPQCEVIGTSKKKFERIKVWEGI